MYCDTNAIETIQKTMHVAVTIYKNPAIEMDSHLMEPKFMHKQTYSGRYDTCKNYRYL